MNRLTVGTGREDFYTGITEPFLLIADKCPDITLSNDRKAIYLNLDAHKFNALEGLDSDKQEGHLQALGFTSALDESQLAGPETLTRRYSNHQILKALSQKRDEPIQLEKIITNSKDTRDAYEKIERLSFSPTLRKFLTDGPTTFKLDRTIIAVLDRARLGRFDAFAIANFLIARYPSQIVIPDYGRYACAFHTTIIDQERMIVGVRHLNQLPEEILDDVVLMEKKIVSRCTPQDAETMAPYFGYGETITGYHQFIADCVSGKPQRTGETK